MRRKVRGRVRLTDVDRLFLIQLYRWFPSVLKAITIVRPETLVRWHRAGFRRYWRWKSRSLGGRPQIDADSRAPHGSLKANTPITPVPAEAGSVPSHESLGANNRDGLEDRWKCTAPAQASAMV